MNKEEFEKRTGFYPSVEMYSIIEEFYLQFDGEKDTFCAAFKKNKDNIAKKIQSELDSRNFKVAQSTETIIHDLNLKIEEQRKRMEREEEWKPYVDTHNVSQADYDALKKGGARELTDEEAKDLLFFDFGFSKEKIQILRSVPKYEVNRHRRLRQVGTLERIPLYSASDWNYIRFDCGCRSWEFADDNLRSFLF